MHRARSACRRNACDDASMPPLPGTAPWQADGGRTGFLLCHGFTGSPAAMRPWAEHLARAGFTVRLPRLPGHGTTWQDMDVTRWPDWFAAVERALHDLSGTCDAIFVGGLSMGGTLALRLAEVHPSRVTGLVLVNPSILSDRHSMRALPVVRRVVRSVGAVTNDIALADVDEQGYERTPLAALHSLTQFWRVVRADLPTITTPVLLLRSATDHIVEPRNSEVILGHLSSSDVTEVVLEHSLHVATLDVDAPEIFARSVEFATRLTAREDAVAPSWPRASGDS